MATQIRLDSIASTLRRRSPGTQGAVLNLLRGSSWPQVEELARMLPDAQYDKYDGRGEYILPMYTPPDYPLKQLPPGTDPYSPYAAGSGVVPPQQPLPLQPPVHQSQPMAQASSFLQGGYASQTFGAGPSSYRPIPSDPVRHRSYTKSDMPPTREVELEEAAEVLAKFWRDAEEAIHMHGVLEEGIPKKASDAQEIAEEMQDTIAAYIGGTHADIATRALRVFTYELDGLTVGAVLVKQDRNDPGKIYVEGIVTHPGVNGGVVPLLEAVLANAGPDPRVSLASQEEHSLHLYRRFGFQHSQFIRSRRDFNRLDVVLSGHTGRMDNWPMWEEFRQLSLRPNTSDAWEYRGGSWRLRDRQRYLINTAQRSREAAPAYSAPQEQHHQAPPNYVSDRRRIIVDVPNWAVARSRGWNQGDHFRLPGPGGVLQVFRVMRNRYAGEELYNGDFQAMLQGG